MVNLKEMNLYERSYFSLNNRHDSVASHVFCCESRIQFLANARGTVTEKINKQKANKSGYRLGLKVIPLVITSFLVIGISRGFRNCQSVTRSLLT